MQPALNIALLGCGVIAQRTLGGLSALLRSHNARVSALCDPVGANRRSVAQACPDWNMQEYSSIDTLLAESDANAVIVATPIALHFDHVHQALSAGRHVYCHKTLADTAKGCHRLAELALGTNLKLAASPGQILLPAYARAAEIVLSGQLGDIVSIDAATEAMPHRFEPERTHEAPAPGHPYSWEWYHKEAAGGGPLKDMFVYPLAFLTELLGDVTRASAKGRLITPTIQWRGRTIRADTPDSYCGLLEFGNALATFRASFSSNGRKVPWGTICIRGTDCCLEIEKRSDLFYRIFVSPNGRPASIERHEVFETIDAVRLGRVECHVLTDLSEFLSACVEDRPVRGGHGRKCGARRSWLVVAPKERGTGRCLGRRASPFHWRQRVTRIGVIGAAGTVGRRIVKQLLAADASIHVVALLRRHDTELAGWDRCSVIAGGIFDPFALEQATKDSDLMINLAARNPAGDSADWEARNDFFRINGLGAGLVAAAAERHKRPLVHFSTVSVYETAAYSPAKPLTEKEAMPCRGEDEDEFFERALAYFSRLVMVESTRSTKDSLGADFRKFLAVHKCPDSVPVYGLSKLIGEALVLNTSRQVCCIRMSDVYGPGHESRGVVIDHLVCLAEHRTLSVDLGPRSGVYFIYIDDVARLLGRLVVQFQLGPHPPPRIMNFCGERIDNRSMRKHLIRLCAECGLHPETRIARRTVQAFDRYYAEDLFERRFPDFEKTPFTTGLRRAFDALAPRA